MNTNTLKAVFLVIFSFLFVHASQAQPVWFEFSLLQGTAFSPSVYDRALLFTPDVKTKASGFSLGFAYIPSKTLVGIRMEWRKIDKDIRFAKGTNNPNGIHNKYFALKLNVARMLSTKRFRPSIGAEFGVITAKNPDYDASTDPETDKKYSYGSFAPKLGLRYFISNRIALHADLSVDLLGDQSAARITTLGLGSTIILASKN